MPFCPPEIHPRPGPTVALGLQRRSSISDSVRRILPAAVLSLVLAPTHLEAQQNVATQKDYEDPLEMRGLPEFCRYTQIFRDHLPGGKDPDQIARWTNLLGHTFIHLHHYCWGLMATNRAFYMSRTSEQRGYNLSQSINEFNYVIERSPQDFVLLPEILTKKGENLIQMDKGPQGVSELRGAIDLKPDYWPPYAWISDYFKEVGDLPKAREWLEKGLSAAPNTRPLMRRMAELDSVQGNRDKNRKRP
jgi:tetratricopeptide (TPR) repeat protein